MSKHEQRISNKLIKFIIFLPIIGFVFALGVTLPINKGVGQKWELLSASPEKAIKILEADYDGVYIKAVNEKVYYCDRGSFNSHENCWVEANWPKEDQDDPFQVTSPNFIIAKSPGQVVDRVSYAAYWQHGTSRIDYVLLDDGSIWMWGHGTNTQFVFFYVFVGFWGGFALAILIFLSLVICEESKRRRAKL